MFNGNGNSFMKRLLFKKYLKPTKPETTFLYSLETACLMLMLVLRLWSPGLVVMGGDSSPEDRGFESQHHILDGHVFTYICCKNCKACLKRQKEKKRGRGGPFLKILGVREIVITRRDICSTWTVYLILSLLLIIIGLVDAN